MNKSDSFALSAVGRVRTENQDRYLADRANGIYAVADGVGGAPHGEAAAEAALAAVSQRARKGFASLPKPIAPDDLRDLARRCVEAAGDAVAAIAKRGGTHDGAATTLTVLLHHEACAAMAHVGDSRLYLYRQRRLEQLSVDHTVANELHRAGTMSPERARRHPLRNVLSRSLGAGAGVEIDTLVLALAPGDIFLLATDGLNEAVDEVGVSHSASLPDNARRLLERANALGGKDNATAVFIRIEDVAEDPRVRAVELLESVTPFAGLDLASRSRVVGAAFLDTLAAGETLVRPHDALAGLVVVVEGRLAWTADTSLELGPGSWFAEAALVGRARSPAHVSATELTRVLVLSPERWNKLARRRPRVGVEVLRAIAAGGFARHGSAVVPHHGTR
ncbi:MAG: protein phosphatase 2C domain-containing protein [Nannocystaceae bacterium]|nr:protein phosphatase 2C domain-containing protein [bacterium]